MLIGISPLFSPDLLSTFYRMGHGDEIVRADAHFPGESINPHVIRADGLNIPSLLDALLSLFALDKTESSLIMMQPSQGDSANQTVEHSYWDEVIKHWLGTALIVKIERFAFYERAKKAFAVVMTGETKIHANIILKKGVTPIQN
jgi:L-fucose mutarotase